MVNKIIIMIMNNVSIKYLYNSVTLFNAENAISQV